MYCLDTNVVIAAIKGGNPVARRLDAELSKNPLAISAIVLFELEFGVANSSRRAENARRLRDFLTAPISVLPFEREDSNEAADIRAALRRSGTPIGPYDVLIAAQARRRSAVLVTANIGEFTRVPALETDDWTSL